MPKIASFSLKRSLEQHSKHILRLLRLSGEKALKGVFRGVLPKIASFSLKWSLEQHCKHTLRLLRLYGDKA